MSSATALTQAAEPAGPLREFWSYFSANPGAVPGSRSCSR